MESQEGITTVYMVRHAECVGNVEDRLTGRVDFELTDKGREQAEELAKKFNDIKFDAVYSSPEKRAVHTGMPTAKMQNLDIIIDKDLAEMYFGEYDGFTWKEVNKINPLIKQGQITKNVIQGISNQETTEQVEKRMCRAVSKIVSSNKEKTILIVSHGVAIEAYLRSITKVPFEQERERYSQKCVAVNIIEYCKNNANVIKLNNIEL